MRTKLNDKLKNFFDNTKTEKITIESIEKYFKDIKEKNEYGGLLHAAVHNKYPEDAVLRFIEVLLENGVDVNLKGSSTGYSFIHLALYGYTEKEKDFTYSTDFIVKLINLGKKHNLDVRIVDNDSDSLIHTALASEVYTGSIMELIEALGDGFDISSTDSNGDDVYQALLKYKKEAANSKNKEWLKKLASEENEIKRIVEISKYNLEEINEELKEIKSSFEELIDKTEINYILENYGYINELHRKLDLCLEKKKLIAEQNDCIFSDVWEKYSIFLKKIICDYSERLSKNPDSLKIEELIKIATSFEFLDIVAEVEKVKENYQNRIDSFRKRISAAKTLIELKNLEEETLTFSEDKIKQELKVLLVEKEEKFTKIIVEIKKRIGEINLINSFLEEKKNSGLAFDLIDDFSNMNVCELENYNLKLKDVITYNKELLKEIIENEIDTILSYIEKLGSNNIFEVSELFKIFDEKIVYEEKKLKGKGKRKGK